MYGEYKIDPTFRIYRYGRLIRKEIREANTQRLSIYGEYKIDHTDTQIHRYARLIRKEIREANTQQLSIYGENKIDPTFRIHRS